MLLTRQRLFGAGLWAFTLASAPAALAQDCAEPASSTDLTRAINDAQATIAQLDIEAFKVAVHGMVDLLDTVLDKTNWPLPEQGVDGMDYVLVGRQGATATLPFCQLQDDFAKALCILHGKLR